MPPVHAYHAMQQAGALRNLGVAVVEPSDPLVGQLLPSLAGQHFPPLLPGIEERVGALPVQRPHDDDEPVTDPVVAAVEAPPFDRMPKKRPGQQEFHHRIREPADGTDEFRSSRQELVPRVVDILAGKSFLVGREPVDPLFAIRGHIQNRAFDRVAAFLRSGYIIEADPENSPVGLPRRGRCRVGGARWQAELGFDRPDEGSEPGLVLAVKRGRQYRQETQDERNADGHGLPRVIELAHRAGQVIRRQHRNTLIPGSRLPRELVSTKIAVPRRYRADELQDIVQAGRPERAEPGDGGLAVLQPGQRGGVRPEIPQSSPPAR